MLRADKNTNLPGASSIGASPGYTWGKSGNLTSNTYLLNDTVPSNLTPRGVSLTSVVLSKIYVKGEIGLTYTTTLAVERWTGAAFVEIATISLAAQRTKSQSYTVSLPDEPEIAVKIKSGSIKNPVVEIIFKGDSL